MVPPQCLFIDIPVINPRPYTANDRNTCEEGNLQRTSLLLN